MYVESPMGVPVQRRDDGGEPLAKSCMAVSKSIKCTRGRVMDPCSSRDSGNHSTTKLFKNKS